MRAILPTRLPACACAFVSLIVSFVAGANAEPIALGRTKQLFFDDEVIERQQNVRRIVHPVRKHPGNPIVRADSPWEDERCSIYGSVVKDGSLFRMWYYTSIAERPSDNRTSTTGVAYAESRDGLHWTKPELDFITIGARKTNLLFERGRSDQQGQTIPHFHELLGVHKSAKSAEYRMGVLSIERPYSGPSEDPFHKGERRGFGVATSRDGLTWTSVNPFTTDSICDGDSHWMFDEGHDRFVLYGRTKHRSEELIRNWTSRGQHAEWVSRHYWGRAVARVESPDFVQWNHTEPEDAPIVMSADEQDDAGTEIYSMMVFPYESVYVGLVQVFHNQPDRSHLDFQLAVSRDTVHFERVGERATFLPCGDVGTWDRFNNSIATNPPIRVGDELWFYYSGRSRRHGPYFGDDAGVDEGAIGVASIPVDRFVSVAGSYNDAQLTTKPLLIKNKSLFVNAQSQFGRIQVEVVDLNGRVLGTSNSIQTDGVRQRVRWKDQGLELGARPVRLRFSLENAHLFAFWSE